MLDGGENGFLQGINASQYQKMAKVSKANATHHLADLLEKGGLEKMPGAVEIPVIRSNDAIRIVILVNVPYGGADLEIMPSRKGPPSNPFRLRVN
ncbi:hypothetical protein ACV1C4_22915 [Aeromonas hydrophila]